jgi:oxygen-independent coproporphyrinogen-3 oxidase
LAGIYIHIPFCKRKCHYCNFFSLASLKYRQPFLEALSDEIFLQRHYLSEQAIHSVYFGGGTPSFLDSSEIGRILEQIRGIYPVSQQAEITVEMNPDDVTSALLNDYRMFGINRLSIGIQSFHHADLEYLNRVHSIEQALDSITLAGESGFDNLSVDLIYGIPGQTESRLENNLERVFSFGIPHISAYSLTVEPKTALDVLIRKKKLPAPSEETAIGHFRLLQQSMKKNGYEQYEISNFCRNGRYSIHNSNYWKGIPYLGFGPSAHSFNGKSRQWNVASVIQYAEMIRRNERFYEIEQLSSIQKFNEYVMLSLRTARGCSLEKIRQEYGDLFADSFPPKADRFIRSGQVKEENGIYYLTSDGMLMADRIAMELFADE